MCAASHQPTILIVDDHGTMRALVRQFLQTAFPDGVIAETASGQGALEFIRMQLPRVVLMDIHLPDANGIDLTAQIKAMLPEVRVIIVSQYDKQTYKERAQAAGACGYVVKENIYADLLPIVARALGTARD
jgi:DNA-binding NarL/FixJ family response regulator